MLVRNSSEEIILCWGGGGGGGRRVRLAYNEQFVEYIDGSVQEHPKCCFSDVTGEAKKSKSVHLIDETIFSVILNAPASPKLYTIVWFYCMVLFTLLYGSTSQIYRIRFQFFASPA